MSHVLITRHSTWITEFQATFQRVHPQTTFTVKGEPYVCRIFLIIFLLPRLITFLTTLQRVPSQLHILDDTEAVIRVTMGGRRRQFEERRENCTRRWCAGTPVRRCAGVTVVPPVARLRRLRQCDGGWLCRYARVPVVPPVAPVRRCAGAPVGSRSTVYEFETCVRNPSCETRLAFWTNQSGQFYFRYLGTREQLADIFLKGTFTTIQLNSLMRLFDIHPPPWLNGDRSVSETFGSQFLSNVLTRCQPPTALSATSKVTLWRKAGRFVIWSTLRLGHPMPAQSWSSGGFANVSAWGNTAKPSVFFGTMRRRSQRFATGKLSRNKKRRDKRQKKDIHWSNEGELRRNTLQRHDHAAEKGDDASRDGAQVLTHPVHLQGLRRKPYGFIRWGRPLVRSILRAAQNGFVRCRGSVRINLVKKSSRKSIRVFRLNITFWWTNDLQTRTQSDIRLTENR